ncbi:MAG TPA: FliM/FliN family flagellar motor switch protein [Methylomirabilota bacterium]|nr:FliM/FliN family flagellar motor switch protein [Methylomirabilota bacterium]
MTVTHATPPVQKFCEMWKESFVAVLGQLGVASPSASIIGQPAALATSPLDSEKTVIAHFVCAGAVTGDLYLMAEKPVAVSCAQLLMSEPVDSSVAFEDPHRDAFTELLRQVAGDLATQWKQETGREITLQFDAEGRLNLDSPLNAALRLRGEKIPELSLSLLLSPAVCDSLAAVPAEPPKEEESPKPSPQSAASVQPQPVDSAPLSEPPRGPLGPLPSNLELLLDVELDATIRFGRHEMLLRDILGLMPGVVVELDQLINEPAELLVAGRMIARGEVVVVDGNFGLQVTEVASDRQKAEILQLQ